MATLEKKHIETIDKTLTKLCLYGCTDANLIHELFRIQDYLYEKKNEESDKERLESIERDAKRLEEIGRRIQRLKTEFERLEAKMK